MLKTIITDAIVSPGYEGSPALKFSEKGDVARFRIGKKLYDPKGGQQPRCLPPSITQPLVYRASKIYSPHIMPQPKLDSPAPEMLHCGHLL